ncbi:hypothetical protein KAJ89_05705 [Candidatus Parcubacteria bacterium]|nr:hypothetical protein [Candidatus Parcubacteria bacterium]
MLKVKNNKFFAGLIIVVVAVVILDVAVYAVYKGFSQATPSLKLNSAQASSMSIKTNKSSYASGETVIVTIINSGVKSMIENEAEEITVKGAPNLGKNYGVALIEKYNEDGWLAIEALWRCDSACIYPCTETQAIKPGEIKVFIWDQTRKLCQGDGVDIETVNAGAGRYRISSAVLDPGGGHKLIHSEEFIIK